MSQTTKLMAGLLNLRIDSAMRAATQNLTPALGREVLSIIDGKNISVEAMLQEPQRLKDGEHILFDDGCDYVAKLMDDRAKVQEILKQNRLGNNEQLYYIKLHSVIIR